MIQYHWLDLGLLNIISLFDNTTILETILVEVNMPLDWEVVPVDSNTRVCSFFDECFIPF